MCAFAILAMMSAFLTRIFVENVDKGTNALSHREIREAADTIFRKMIYEWEQYKDGDSRTLDEEYGTFADLQGYQKDRWAIYRYTLEKKPTTVVGTVTEGEDTLFDPNDDGSSPITRSNTTGSQSNQNTTNTTGTSASGTAASDASTGIELIKMTLKIYFSDSQNDQPILTLTTWIDPQRGRVVR